MIRMRTSLRLLISMLQRERSNRQCTHRHINRQMNRLTQSNKQLSVVMLHTLRVFCRGQKQNGKSMLFSDDILLALEIFHPPQGNFWLCGEFLFSWGKKSPHSQKGPFGAKKSLEGIFFKRENLREENLRDLPFCFDFDRTAISREWYGPLQCHRCFCVQWCSRLLSFLHGQCDTTRHLHKVSRIKGEKYQEFFLNDVLL